MAAAGKASLGLHAALREARMNAERMKAQASALPRPEDEEEEQPRSDAAAFGRPNLSFTAEVDRHADSRIGVSCLGDDGDDEIFATP